MAFDEEQALVRIRTELVTATTLPPEANRAYFNHQFETPSIAPDDANVSWFRETFQMISENRLATEQETVRFRVVYDVFVLAGTGSHLLSETTRAIKEVFIPGDWLRGPPNDCPIVIETSQRGLAAKDPETEAWLFQPVELICRSHVPAPSLYQT
jgi:hypothetical protein